MSNPLSSLTTSRQNSRAFSADPEDATGKRESLDGLLVSGTAAENPLLSPKKIVEDARRNFRQSLGYENTGYKSPGQSVYDEDPDPFQVPQSSPFRYDGRDDTVDLHMLQKRQASLGMSERSATPRKRSYDQGPDVHDVEVGGNDRYRKGLGRRVPDINVYADEDSEYSHERSLNDSVVQDIASSMVEEEQHEGMSTALRENNHEIPSVDREDLDNHDTDDAMIDDDSHDPMDDTCFSTFSAVPNVDMTAFANLRGDSPFKSPRPLPSCPVDIDNVRREDMALETPIAAKKSPRKNPVLDMSSPVSSPSPRKRGPGDNEESSGTPNLLDFTDQVGLFPRRQRYSIQQERERYTPSRRSPLRNAREFIRSPAKVSLLDFDIPSAPTPRSIPTITPRELESLKSGFLSEISSLKATLSGKEVEVSSLKQAVSDAERRVGEALEEVRNEAARKETLEVEQAEWQRRGREMEEVLRSVKADIVDGEHEREHLLKKIEESDKGKEQLESRIVELETRLDAARKSATCKHGTSETSPAPTKTAEETANEVQDAVEKVARELHTLYKNKHETKVAALKKSYEARWEKRLREAEIKLKAANEENERLRAERDAALESARPDSSMIVNEKEEHEAEKRVLESQIQGLQQEMASLKEDSEQLRTELKAERVEKGNLVALVEEWLEMQNQNGPPPPPPQHRNDEMTPEPVSHEAPPPTTEDSEQGIISSNSSGIRGPPSSSSSSSSSSNHGERKIPRIGAPGIRHGRGNSGGKSGIAVFTPGKSGIMGSIERMGRGGAA